MKALALLALIATPAAAEPIADVVRARLLASLPPGTDVAEVHVPPPLAKLDVEPAHVSVEIVRALAIGRSSIKVAVRGKRAQFVPVTIGAVVPVAIAKRGLLAGETIAASDVVVEQRAATAAAGAAALVGATVKSPIDAGSIVRAADITLAPPIPRGTQITVELVRGTVRVRGTGTLELAARPGDAATVRLAHTRAIVRGTLADSTTVVVGGSP